MRQVGGNGELPGGYVEVRGDGNQLLFRFDPQRDLIEIKPKGGRRQIVDLRPLRDLCLRPVEGVVWLTEGGD